jgi:RHS repeat-associated protein
LPAPLALPEQRAAAAVGIFPTYSPEGGLSEWGMGWGVDLSIRRHALTGDIDYAANEFESPWGRLAAGDDGAYYVVGLVPRLRFHRRADGWVAIDPAGTQYRFARAEATEAGIYAWHLNQVETINGDLTEIEYVTNDSGRHFVRSVLVGSAATPAVYRATFDYASVAVPTVSLVSGARRVLDRQVSQVAVSVRQGGGSTYVPRWRFELTYRSSETGPAFYLASVRKVYASGKAEPPVSYSYDTDLIPAVSDEVEPLPTVDAYLTQVGASGLQPDRAVLVDIDQDGRLDIEHHWDFALFHQTDQGLVREALPPATPDVDIDCRPAASGWNRPRRLARMTPASAAPEVVHTQVGAGSLRTFLRICSRAGQRMFAQEVDGTWDLARGTRLADVNRDHAADLVRWNNGTVQVLPNRSDEGGYGFGTMVTTELRADGRPARVRPSAIWIEDVNGDGRVDLLAGVIGTVYVWYGTGDYRFERDAQGFSFTDRLGSRISRLDRYTIQWTDANKDGLVDAILSRSNRVYLHLNNGQRFVEQDLEFLRQDDLFTGAPVFADLSGSGEAELVYVRRGAAHVRRMTRASTGLMVAADDGKGTTLQFSYQRSPAWAGLGRRISVLSELEINSGGYDPFVVVYDYEEPVRHRVSQSLIGFGVVRTIAAVSMHELHLYHDDTVANVVLESISTDARTGLFKIANHTYEDQQFAGIGFKRLLTTRSGWRALDGRHEASVSVHYQAYEGLCATAVRREGGAGVQVRDVLLARPSGLQGALHCLPEVERLRGIHTDSARDFVLEQETLRNERGQIRRIVNRGDGISQTLQEVAYDQFGRVSRIDQPGRGTTSVTYDPVTGLLQSVIAPDGVGATADRRDPATDALLELATDRGGEPLVSSFAYDDMERLVKSWRSVGGSSAELPLLELAYRWPTGAQPGLLTKRALVDASTGSAAQAVTFVAADGQKLADATRIPEGWAMGDLVATDREQLITRRFWRAPLAGEQALDTLTFAGLASDTVLLGTTTAAGFGHDVQTTAVVQDGVERATATELTLVGDELVTTTVENGTYTSRRGTDLWGHIRWIEDQAGGVTRFEHDALGRMVAVVVSGDGTDDVRHQVRFDSLGRVSEVERDGVGALGYEYEPATGLLAKRLFRDAQGNLERERRYEYDAIGRLTRETMTLAATGAESIIEYRYDGVDRQVSGQRGYLSEVAGDGFAKTMLYDVEGRVQRATMTVGDWREVVTESEYYAGGQPRRVHRTTRDVATGTVVDELVQEFVYDAYGRLAMLRVNGADLAALIYDSEGKLDRASIAGGGVIAYEYDRVTKALRGYWRDAGAWNVGVEWTFDARAQIASEDVAFASDYVRREYSYDVRGFLVSATEGEQIARYAYDSAGLPTRAEDRAGDRDLVRDSGTLVTDAAEYRYDQLGRVVSKDDLKMTYGPDGQLRRAVRGDDEFSFFYDEQGARVLKKKNGRPVAAYVGGGYLTEAGFVTPVELGGQLVGVIQGAQFHLLATDPRGSVLANQDGAPRLLSPYGVRSVRPDLSAAVDFVASGYDPDLGAVRFGVRDYDPYLGQFRTPDPLFFEDIDRCADSPVECNLYGYARNNPLTFTDRSGMGSLFEFEYRVFQERTERERQMKARERLGADPGRDAAPSGRVSVADLFLALAFKNKGPGEVRVGVSMLWTVRAVRAVQKEAYSEAARVARDWAPDSRRHNDWVDAFRHAYFSYRLTQEIGDKAAKGWGDAHERSVPNPTRETAMDLWNNAVGRELARDPANLGRDAASVIFDAYRNGLLRIEPFEFTDLEKSSSQPDYENAEIEDRAKTYAK